MFFLYYGMKIVNKFTENISLNVLNKNSPDMNVILIGFNSGYS